MDSLGDYVYLIILAVAGLSGLLKKKKEVTNSGSAPKSNKKSWEDVLRDLIPIEEEEEEKKPVFANTPARPIVPVEYLSYETAVDPMALRAKKPVSQMVSAKNPVVTEIKTDTTNQFLAELHLESTDDAKRAFVYSEIFNRKY